MKGGGSNTIAGQFILTLAIVASRSRSTSRTRRRARYGVAAGTQDDVAGDLGPSVHHALRVADRADRSACLR
jgi:hypothetical protein